MAAGDVGSRESVCVIPSVSACVYELYTCF